MDPPDHAPDLRSRWGHLTLLISLLFLFLLSPFVVTLHYGVLFINIVGAVVLLAGTYAVSERKRLFAVTVVFAILSVISSALILVVHAEWIVVASHLFLVTVLGLFSVSILGYVLRPGRVTGDKIYAAICVYLLAGYAWAFVYALLHELQPGSFSGLAEVEDYAVRVMQMRYFSFVTLTTLGYGDIIPRSPAARTFATLEAVMGQIYLAVLVARLVGLHIVHATTKSRTED
jgi:voltage-gated potassium channel